MKLVCSRCPACGVIEGLKAFECSLTRCPKEFREMSLKLEGKWAADAAKEAAEALRERHLGQVQREVDRKKSAWRERRWASSND